MLRRYLIIWLVLSSLAAYYWPHWFPGAPDVFVKSEPLLFALIAVTMGKSFDFDPTFTYAGSLVYLAVVASVVAFWSFLTLQERIGAGRAGYAAVLFPVIALTMSTVFEDFHWTPTALGGVALVLLGNALVLATGPLFRRRRAPEAARGAS